jgi:DedD protein
LVGISAAAQLIHSTHVKVNTNGDHQRRFFNCHAPRYYSLIRTLLRYIIMNDSAKKRLVGLVAVVAIAAVFVPMLFEEQPPQSPAIVNTLPNEPIIDNLNDDLPLADPLLDANAPPTDEFNSAAPIETETPMRSTASVADDPELNLDVGAAIPDVEFAPPVSPPRRTTARPELAPLPVPASRSPSSKPKPAAPKVAASTPKPASKPVVKPADQPVEQKSSWVIQVASLGNAETAANLQKKLQKAGFSAFVEKAEVRGKSYYRVRVGPQKNRAAAERMAAKLRQQHKLDTLIHRR